MFKRLALSMLVIALVLGSGFAAFASWNKSYQGIPEDIIRDMCFINENKGWAVGTGGTLFTTNDGGAKWEKVEIEEVKESDMFVDLWSVFFLDDKNGWICGDLLRGSGVILSTQDGGKKWDRQSSGSPSALYSIFFVDKNTGWASGGNGTILGTSTGGSKWAPLVTGKAGAAIGEGDPGFADIQFLTPQKGWIAGDNGTIKMSIDGGKTWTPQTCGTDSNLSALKFVNENVGWAVGEGGAIVSTTDGGKTWTANKTTGTTDWMYDVDFVNEQDGFIVGEFSTLLHTSDGGKTWKQGAIKKQKGFENLEFDAVACPKLGFAYAGGGMGTIIKYTP